MASKYTVQDLEGNVLFSSSRKDRAEKFGETLTEAYQVLTPAGKVVVNMAATPEPTTPDGFNPDAGYDDPNMEPKPKPEAPAKPKPPRGKGSRYGALTVDRNPAHDLDETDDGVVIKAGKKWTYVYDATGSLIAEVRNDAFSTVVSVLEG